MWVTVTIPNFSNRFSRKDCLRKVSLTDKDNVSTVLLRFKYVIFIVNGTLNMTISIRVRSWTLSTWQIYGLPDIQSTNDSSNRGDSS